MWYTRPQDGSTLHQHLDFGQPEKYVIDKMKFSLLLAGLTQRLILVAIILAILWSVYFWAVTE